MVETSLTCIKVKSDVFCNGALVLPDKAARVLSIGGWSVDSLYGVRLYLPDGEPGVNGTNDWEEDFSVLRLQVNEIIHEGAECKAHMTSNAGPSLVSFRDDALERLDSHRRW